MPLDSPALHIRGLTKHYGRQLVLDRLNMEVPAGSLYGFLGVNGAGKTTTFGLLSGYLRREVGTITINGKLSILPQDARFYPGRTVQSQLSLFARLSGVGKREVKAEVEQVLEMVGLQESRRMTAEKLSHGMTKRLAIAQALLGNPDIILLDEPTSGLDPRNVYELRQLIGSLGKNKTLVISSHILAEISEICDTVGILHQGRMHFEGPLADITRQETRVNFYLEKNPDPARLQEIPEILNLNYDSVKQELAVHFDPSHTKVADLNRKVITCLLKQDIGIREIRQGNTLEEGFLKLLQ